MFKIYFEVYIAFLGDYEFVRGGGAVNLICDPSEMYISGNKLMKAWGILIFWLVILTTRPGCFCAKDCRDSVEMYIWWYTFTCTGGGGL